jgi:MFS family permease
MTIFKRHASSLAKAPGTAFRRVAFAFTAVMAFTTVPTPLWSLFAARDHLSSLTVTVVFGIYALAVAASLFLIGHLSDTLGRRPVLASALALNMLAAAVFVILPQLPGLVLARVLSGLGVGALTATAMAWLAELHEMGGGPGGERAQLVAVAANLGGLGLGGLVAGALAEWVGQALTLPFLILLVAMVLTVIGIRGAPETHPAPSPRPRYHTQRISVPSDARGRFFAAAVGSAVAFSLFGLATSLGPSFLAGTLGHSSYALAGAVAFGTFAAAALAQMLTRSRAPRQLLGAGIPVLLAGIGLLTLALWLPTPSVTFFIAGDLIAGAGSGLMFKGAIATASEISLPGRRAETLAGVYLASYLGLAVPVIGLGALTQVASARVGVLAFGAVLVAGILAATPALLGGRRWRASPQPQPASC